MVKNLEGGRRETLRPASLPNIFMGVTFSLPTMYWSVLWLSDMWFFRLTKAESLINSNIYIPQCRTDGLVLPGVCNCGKHNTCGRLSSGRPRPAVLFDTKYTLICTNITERYCYEYLDDYHSLLLIYKVYTGFKFLFSSMAVLTDTGKQKFENILKF